MRVTRGATERDLNALALVAAATLAPAFPPVAVRRRGRSERIAVPCV
jgi:hypothetical protein